MKVEMTGKEDRESPWKIAIGGFPGSGKTLFASTAPNPLFVFFRENPRIKSIADRHIPHVKVVNDSEVTVLEKMQALAVHLELNMDYDTLVIDTGDELQQAMKEARRIQNGGEFGISDWGWIGDAYRELLQSYIDLPMRVIVLFHVKTAQEGEDGHMFRELLLQGTVKDEVAGWFDVVGALDTYEVVDDDGDMETKRVLLTHSSRMYPWVKDHSGNLPRQWELSENFIDDVRSLETILNETEIETPKEVLDEVAENDRDPGHPEPKKVTPEELEAMKSSDTPEINKALDTVNEVIGIAEEVDPSLEEDEETKVETPTDPVEEEPQMEEVQLPTGDEPEEPSPEPVTTEKEEPEEISYTCDTCGEESTEDVAKMSKIRFKKVLCRDHFREELRGE